MPETIGQRLRKEREARYIKLEKAAAETRIRAVFLQALENDDYSIMPSAAQGRGFLRNYAEYLGLNLNELIAEIQKNPPQVEISGPLPQVNLTETEPPIELAEEKEARTLWTVLQTLRWRKDSTPKENPPAPRRAEQTPLEPESEPEAESQPEASPPAWSLFSRLAALLPRRQKPAPKSDSDIPPKKEEERQNSAREPLLPADQIFAEIGARLRERRELISLTVEEVERHTKLRAVFIRALEAGDYNKLPSPVQTRGMLANYASFLDMDVDAVLLRYADGLQARRREKYAETPREKIQTQVNVSLPLWRSFLAGDLIFGFVIIAMLIGLAIWGVRRVILSEETAAAAPTAPPISQVLGEGQPTAPVGVTFVPVDEGITTPTPAEILTVEAVPTLSAANVSVTLFALERVFVRAVVDGKVAFEGRLAPRETKTFEADDQVQILTGNGSALRVTYNGTDLGLMGRVGEVVSRVYLITGVATPTATIPPTPTNTLPATQTPTPTLTPVFTPPDEQ